MQYDENKVFPYPVLRPDRLDYVDGAFQTQVQVAVSDDASEVNVNVEFDLSVAEIQAKIDTGEAEFVAVIASRETFYRTTLRTAKYKATKKFDANQIRGELIISPFIVAKQDIKGFKSVDINPEFGASSFAFEAGEVLAIDTPGTVYFDRELFKPVTSVLVLVRDSTVPEWEVKYSFDQDKLRILVGNKTKEVIDRARNTQVNRSILINSIYSSAVAEAINELKLGDQYDEWKWAKVIRHQCHNKSLDLEKSPSYQLTQELLDKPLRLMEHVFMEEET